MNLGVATTPLATLNPSFEIAATVHSDNPVQIIDPNTEWNSSDIWIRRSFDLDNTDLVSPHFLVFYDDGAEVYLNGEQVLSLPHSAQFYRWIPFNDATENLLKKTGNSIAVHCHNEHHPQFIDVGIIDVLPPAK